MKRKRSLLYLLSAFVLTGALFLCSCGSNENGDAPKAVCNNGVMVGQVENGVTSYLGIPYAKQPVDDLRWKAPVAAEDSDEEIICDSYSNTALQYEWPTEQASYSEKGEDCLTLNIWSSGDAENKPVMFWIHGGGYSWGGTTDPIYDGQKFAEANPDVILITANYRLGMMAWADFSQVPGGEEYTDLNLGLRDNICALEWVQKNIEAFGGDPNNVTIFGESAGGASVNTLTASPAARGLFQKAIIESGSNDAPDSIEDARAFAELMMETAGCSSMDEMLELTSEELIELDTEYWLGDESPGPVVDGVIVPEDYEAGLKEAAASGVKLMIGYNGDEDYYFVQEYEGDHKKQQWKENHLATWDETYNSLPADGQALMDEYMQIQLDQGKDKVFAISEFTTDAEGYLAGTWANAFSEGGGDVYMYYWDVPSTSNKYYKGACHAVELAYVFNNLHDTIYTGENPDEETAKKTQEAWTNFAKTGNPSISDVTWNTYNEGTKETMMITLDGWKMESDPLSRQKEIYRTLMDNYLM